MLKCGTWNAYSLNRLTLFLIDKHFLRSGRCRCVVVGLLAQQLQELIRMLMDQLGKLRITSTDLLEDRLQHLRLGLYDLAKLLKLRIVSEKFEIGGATSCSSSCTTAYTRSGSTCTSTTPRTPSSGASTASLCRCLEQIYWLVTCFAARFCWRCGGSWGSDWLLWSCGCVLPSSSSCAS